MRFVRLGPAGAERPHILLDDDRVLDIGNEVGDFDPAFFADFSTRELDRLLASRSAQAVPSLGLRVGAPVARPGKIVCIGLNYADHAAESGVPIPTEPVVFLKAPNTLVGPNDEVRIPRRSAKTDYEVELAVVIGRVCRYLESDEAAKAAIAGYMISHDVSEREFQLERGGQWDKGKSCETFNPAGPWLVTSDAVVDPTHLDLWLDVNGQRRQAGNTSSMMFSPLQVVRYLSWFMVLDPGDVINTGTPGGVALGRSDHPYLRPGDVVELGISGLGCQRQQFVAAP